jgi:hypothetical protein
VKFGMAELSMSKGKLFRGLKVYGIMAALVVVFILALYFFTNGQGFSMPSSKSGTRPEKTERDPDMVLETQNIPGKSADFIYPETSKRDPFERMTQAKIQVVEATDKRSQSLPVLTAVIWGTGNPIAVLEYDAKRTFLVKTGEEVNSYKVLEISPTSVILENERRKYELDLWREEDDKLRLSSNLNIN